MDKIPSHIPENSGVAHDTQIMPFSATSWEDMTGELSDGISALFESYQISPELNTNLGIRGNFAKQVLDDIQLRIKALYQNPSPKIINSFHIQNGYLVIHDSTNKEFLYTLNSDGGADFVPGEIGQILQEKREAMGPYIDKFRETLDVLEYIFQENDSEWFGFLDDDDRIASDDSRFGTAYRGKTIQEILAIAKKDFENLNISRFSIIGKDSIDDEIYQLEKQYMNITLGLGDRYEGATEYCQKDMFEIQYLVARQVEARPNIESVLAFLQEEHLKIDTNNWQSESVQESYKIYTETLHEAILSRFRQELQQAKESPVQTHMLEKQVIHFVKIITGRDDTNWVESMTTYGNIDREYIDSLTANKALFLLFSRPGGIMDKFSQNTELGKISISDSTHIKNRTPKDICSQFIDLTNKNISDTSSESIISFFGISHLIDSSDSYEELSFIDKGKISLIARLIEKFETTLYDPYSGNQHTYKKNILSFEDLQTQNKEIQKEVSWEFTKEISQTFDGSLEDWNGLDRHQLEQYTQSNGTPLFESHVLDAIDLFHDINGNGWFDISDTSSYRITEGAKIVAIIVGGAIIGTIVLSTLPAAMAIGAGTGSVLAGGSYASGYIGGHMLGTIVISDITAQTLASGAMVYQLSSNIIYQTASIGGSASVVSWGTHPKGYNSFSEAAFDLSSDVVIGSATGGFGGKIAHAFKVPGARIMSLQQIKNLGLIDVPDIAVLGFGTEALRSALVSRAFYTQQLGKSIDMYGKPQLQIPQKGKKIDDKPDDSMNESMRISLLKK